MSKFFRVLAITVITEEGRVEIANFSPNESFPKFTFGGVDGGNSRNFST